MLKYIIVIGHISKRNIWGETWFSRKVHPAPRPNHSHWRRSLGFPRDRGQADHPGVCHALASTYILMNTVSAPNRKHVVA